MSASDHHNGSTWGGRRYGCEQIVDAGIYFITASQCHSRQNRDRGQKYSAAPVLKSAFRHEGNADYGRTPTTPISRPVTPFSARYENRRSVRHDVHSGEASICFAGTPASISCRRLASTRSRKMFTGSLLCPGARAVRKSRGYFSRTG